MEDKLKTLLQKEQLEIERVKNLFRDNGKNYSYSRSEINLLRYLKLVPKRKDDCSVII